LKLVCMGDSLTFGFKMTRKNSWPQIVGENLKIDVKNKGICGDTTAGMLSRFGREVVEEKPEYVLIMGGSNDLASQLPDAVIY
jgi:acyl-CoA thioesterase-1